MRVLQTPQKPTKNIINNALLVIHTFCYIFEMKFIYQMKELQEPQKAAKILLLSFNIYMFKFNLRYITNRRNPQKVIFCAIEA